MKINKKRIMEMLEELDITQNELARRCGIKESSFSAMINGKRGVGGKSIKKLMDAFPNESLEGLIIMG